jgi:hypothetical protein
MYAARQRIMVMIGGSFLLSSVVIFFGFHIFAGERGILARRIKLLQADSLDADMLAETARAELGLYAPNDVIISIDLSNLKFSDSNTEDDVN